MDEIVDWDESTDSWERRHPPVTRADLLAEAEQFAAEAEAAGREWREEHLPGERAAIASQARSLLREILRHPERLRPETSTRIGGV